MGEGNTDGANGGGLRVKERKKTGGGFLPVTSRGSEGDANQRTLHGDCRDTLDWVNESEHRPI